MLKEWKKKIYVASLNIRKYAVTYVPIIGDKCLDIRNGLLKEAYMFFFFFFLLWVYKSATCGKTYGRVHEFQIYSISSSWKAPFLR
jgi:hypothetical protein